MGHEYENLSEGAITEKAEDNNLDSTALVASRPRGSFSSCGDLWNDD